MPGHVAVPHASSIGLSPGYFGGNFLGAHHDPFQTGGDPNPRAAYDAENLREHQVAQTELTLQSVFGHGSG